MNGLHSCKPGNEPVVGHIKMFVVEQRTGKSGKAYTKITSKKAEEGGQPYKILSAKPTGHTDSYGNHSFNIEVEPANGAQTAPQSHPQIKMYAGNGDDRSSRIERQHSQEQAIRYATLKGLTSITTDELRTLIDWFQRDVSHTPSAPAKQLEPVAPYDPSDGSPDDEEIPF
jgi:hypothetical protein